MPRKATGTIQWAKDHYKIRVTLNDGSRPWIPLRKGLTEEEARAKAAAASERVRRENRVMVRRSPETVGGSNETVEDWCERWLKEREARGHANVDNERWSLGRYVYVRFGGEPLASIARDDVESIVEALDRRIAADEMSWKTAYNVWSVVTKMFADACNSKIRALRVLSLNPCLGVQGPDRGGGERRERATSIQTSF